VRTKTLAGAKRRRVGRPLEKNSSALFRELMLARFCEPLCCSYRGANKTCWRSVGWGKEEGVIPFEITPCIHSGGAGGNRTHDLLNAMPTIC